MKPHIPKASQKEGGNRQPEDYKRSLEILNRNPGPYLVFEEPVLESGLHPDNFVDFECAFAARHIRRLAPRSLLDIGSYRHFLLGLLAHYPVTTLDVRERRPLFPGETVLTGDAKRLELPDRSFELVLSLCTLEHLGLGRYGDDLDFEADRKAIREMIRVLKPGGHLVFSTTVTRSRPAIGFNAHRIYSLALLRGFCAELIAAEERFYSHRLKGACPPEEITADPQGWDVYCGCWQKPRFSPRRPRSTRRKNP